MEIISMQLSLASRCYVVISEIKEMVLIVPNRSFLYNEAEAVDLGSFKMNKGEFEAVGRGPMTLC